MVKRDLVDVGKDYTFDRNTPLTSLDTHPKYGRTYQGVRKADKKKLAIKIIQIYHSEQQVYDIKYRLDFLKGRYISGHMTLLDFFITKSEIVLIMDVIQDPTKVMNFKNLHWKDYTFFCLEIIEGILGNMHNGFIHNEFFSRKCLIYPNVNYSGQNYGCQFSLPIHWILNGNLNSDLRQKDLEILSPEAQLGYKANSILSKNKQVVWTLGIIYYEMLFRNRPFTLEKSVEYDNQRQFKNKTSGPPLSQQQKQAVLIRDKKPDYRDSDNECIKSLISKMLQVKDKDRMQQLEVKIAQIDVLSKLDAGFIESTFFCSSMSSVSLQKEQNQTDGLYKPEDGNYKPFGAEHQINQKDILAIDNIINEPVTQLTNSSRNINPPKVKTYYDLKCQIEFANEEGTKKMYDDQIAQLKNQIQKEQENLDKNPKMQSKFQVNAEEIENVDADFEYEFDFDDEDETNMKFQRKNTGGSQSFNTKLGGLQEAVDQIDKIRNHSQVNLFFFKSDIKAY